MGTAKAWLEWHGSTLLGRTAGMLRRTVGGPVVVVAAPDQRLPPLPPGVAVVEDPVEGRGPLQGLAVGLAAVADGAEAAFVCATDMPFLHPAYIRRVLRELTASTAGIALPVARGHRQPLAAAYRPALAARVAADLLAGGEPRLGMLAKHCEVAWLDDERLLADPDLAAHDPGLASVVNVNTREEYETARHQPPPQVTVAYPGEDGGRTLVVRATTLADAAAAAGLPLTPRTTATLNGHPVPAEPWLPLAPGDTIAFPPHG